MPGPGNEDGYPIPAGEIRVEEEIKHSRFITSLAPAQSAEAARAFIERVRAEFPDATHNCWAYAAGPPGSTLHTGMSDDGEPGGNAGRPMLTVLRNSGAGDVAAVVTRYFGGVKLGRGGLARGRCDSRPGRGKPGAGGYCFCRLCSGLFAGAALLRMRPDDLSLPV